MIQTLFGSVEQEPSLLEKLKSGVQKTRAGLVSALEDALQGKREIDADLLDELEFTLISADIGVRTTEEILDRIRQRVERHQLSDAAELRGLIREHLLEILEASERAPARVAEPPAVILVVGVNGSGKTTTIGKLAQRFKRRAALRAAVRRRYVPRRRHRAAGNLGPAHRHAGDPAEPGQRPQRGAVRRPQRRPRAQGGLRHRGHRRPPADQGEPDGELQKMSRTAKKVIPDAPHEVLLVLDATTGQNGLEQARKFTETSGVTGIVLTKLDGTAKGGIVVAIARELNLPIRYVGVGEKVDDLLPFDAEKFIESLFEK